MKLKAHPFARRTLACLFFTTAFLFLEAVTRLATGLPLRSDIAPVLFTAVLGITAGEISTLFRKGGANAAIGSALLSLAALIISVETVLGRAFGYFYPPEIFFGMAGAVTGSYFDSTVSAIISATPYILLCFLPLALYLAIHFASGTLTAFPGTSPQKRAIPLLCAMLAVAALQRVAVGTLQNGTEAEYLYGREGYDFNETAKEFGIFTSLRLSLCYSAKARNNAELAPTDAENVASDVTAKGYNVTDELSGELPSGANDSLIELINYLSARSPSEKNRMTGILADKNLIFVCAEALSPYAISEELTPTLYHMMTNGLYFSEYYAPTFGESTSGGEYALLLSQVPKRDAGERGMSMYLSRNNRLDHSLPGIFAANGYLANGYHDNSYTYYDRNLTHPAMGMNWYGCGGCVTVKADAPELKLDESLSRSWPRSDDELIRATFRSYTDQAKACGQHFFTYYLTVSGHSNYSFSGNAMSAKNKNYTEGLKYPQTVKAYLAAQKELDLALGTLISSLEAEGILDDTVIVVANDHHPYGLSAGWATNDGKDYLSALAGKKLSSTPETERGVFMIYNSALSNETAVTKPVCSFDVLPTLLNMFGFEFDSRLFCGRDVFSKSDGLVFFSDGSFVTGKGIYDSRTKSYTPCFGEEQDEQYVKNVKKEIREIISHSKLVRKTDLFAHLPKKRKEEQREHLAQK